MLPAWGLLCFINIAQKPCTGLHKALDPIALFVPLEYFYLYLSLGKNHNPDDRRYYGGLVEY